VLFHSFERHFFTRPGSEKSNVENCCLDFRAIVGQLLNVRRLRAYDQHERQKSAEIQDAIRKILYHEWDPIGVAGAAPEDEYDSYIAPVYRILVGSRSEQELVEYLHRTARDTIGVAGDTEKHLELARPIARRLLELDVRLCPCGLTNRRSQIDFKLIH
jgi:hypothetical protein